MFIIWRAVCLEHIYSNIKNKILIYMLTTDSLTRQGDRVRDVTCHREGWRRLAGVLRVGAEEDTRATVVDTG